MLHMIFLWPQNRRIDLPPKPDSHVRRHQRARWWPVVIGTALTTGGLAWSPRLAAQSVAAVPNHFASITTDTGDFAPGHRDFSRYTTPGLCQAAVDWTTNVLRRALVTQSDSLRRGAARDTIGAQGVAAVARACDAQFAVQRASGMPALENLVKLALDEHNLPKAQAVLTRAQQANPDIADTLRLIAIDYSLTGVHPANVTAAAALLAPLDHRDHQDLWLQLLAHQPLLEFWKASDDTAHLRQEAEAIVARADGATFDDLDTSASKAPAIVLFRAYRTLFLLTWLNHPDALPTLARQFCASVEGQTLPACTPKDSVPALRDVAPAPLMRGTPPPSVDVQKVVSKMMPGRDFVLNRKDQISAPPIVVDHWFPLPGDDTMVPKPGRSFLVINGCGEHGISVANPEQKRQQLLSKQERIEQWANAYKPQGLQIICLVTTHGNAIFRGQLTPDQEGKAIQWYIQDYSRLPVTVAVRTTPVAWLPAPDERAVQSNDSIRYGQSSQQLGIRYNAGFEFTVIDQDGRIVIIDSNIEDIELVLDHLFRKPSLESLNR